MRDPRFGLEGDPASEPSAREIATLDQDEAAADGTVLRVVPDLRGVRVEDASGIYSGSAWGALAEAETGLVRYVDVELDTLDRHVLVPIGHTRVSDNGEDPQPSIRLRAALLEQLEQVPPYPADVAHIDDPFERSLLEAYGRTFHGDRYYAHPSYDHDGIYAGEHPVVSAAEAVDHEQPLQRLSYLPGWKIATGEPDIRGWPLVLAGDDSRVEITDLIIDTDAERVRYVVVPTKNDIGARLLPIGFLRVDETNDEVIADGFTASDLDELPSYAGGGVTREFEESQNAALVRIFDGPRRYLLPDFRSVV